MKEKTRKRFEGKCLMAFLLGTMVLAATAASATSNESCGNLKIFKFNDKNANGIWETGEPPLGSVVFSVTGPITVNVATNAYGEAFLNCIPYGNYTITEQVPDD